MKNSQKLIIIDLTHETMNKHNGSYMGFYKIKKIRIFLNIELSHIFRG